MTKYTDKELMTEARRAIRNASAKARMKARCEGYSILLPGPSDHFSATLIAHAVRTENITNDVSGGQYRFDVNIAI